MWVLMKGDKELVGTLKGARCSVTRCRALLARDMPPGRLLSQPSFLYQPSTLVPPPRRSH
eukprot:scaffold59214_cov21-Phaeocystis_antarctica.AAC.1